MFLLTTIALAIAQTCRNTGSLSYQRGSIVDQATTYILPSYNIPCDGVVTGWMFCYQTINVSSMTFFPSVWRWSENFTVVHASSVNQNFSDLNSSCTCTKHHLPVDEQFSVHTNDIIGLYSTINTSILTANDSDDNLVYSVEGNHSIVYPNGSGVNQQHFHVAIVAIISEQTLL